MKKNSTTKKTLAREEAPKVTRKDNPTAAKAGGRRTKPKTAYELLERVCEHILEEPKRYWQNDWCVRGSRAICAMWNHTNKWRDEDEKVKPVEPECKTVGCRAGWIVLLHDGPKATPEDFAARANLILGTSCSATNNLFGAARFGQPGTKAYARRGVAGLRVFMARHKTYLKARLLADVPKLEAK